MIAIATQATARSRLSLINASIPLYLNKSVLWVCADPLGTVPPHQRFIFPLSQHSGLATQAHEDLRT